MNHTDFGDPSTFLAFSELLVNCFDNYWSDCCEVLYRYPNAQRINLNDFGNPLTVPVFFFFFTSQQLFDEYLYLSLS